MVNSSSLVTLPNALVSLIYTNLPAHFKLHTCSHLSHSLSSALTPSCFHFDHLYLSPILLRSIVDSPRLAALLSSVSSVSVENDGAISNTLLALVSCPPQTSTISHALSPLPTTALFPNLTFYSQRVDGVGFHPSSLSSFTHLQQMYIDTRRYDASIRFQLSPSFTRLHSLKLHALLSAAQLDAIYGLPALTSLDLAGCTVLGGDIALHNMPLVSLLEPTSATAVMGRLRTLLCPLGEQRVADIVAIATAQQQTAVLEYLRCDDSPLSEHCILDLLALPSLTALEIHTHNIRWEQPPFAALASSTSPPPSPSLQRLRFVADHDLRDRPQPPLAVIQSMSSFLLRFTHLHVLDCTLPSSVALTDVLSRLLQLSALRRLTIARNKSGAAQRNESIHPFDLTSAIQRSESAFPLLHSFTCRRLMHMDESVLTVLLSNMPLLRVLHVSESPWIGSGAVLAASVFCSQLRSIVLLACSKFILEDEHWCRSESELQRVTSGVVRYRPHTVSATPSLANLRFLSLQLLSCSESQTSALQRLVRLLVDSPLHYFGLIIRTVADAVVSAPVITMLPLPHIALLHTLPLIGFAAPTPPRILSPPFQPAFTLNFHYSRQWVESVEARGRRERSVLIAERLSEEVDSDEQLLYEWMTRHRPLSSQQDKYAHVFNSEVSRAAYFNDVRVELGMPRRRETMSVDSGRERDMENGEMRSRRESDDDRCCFPPFSWLCDCLCYGCAGCAMDSCDDGDCDD